MKDTQPEEMYGMNSAAKEYDGTNKLPTAEIINADSMQFYKGLNIGTAKVKEEEKENIPHHLMDIKEPTEDYTVFDYQRDVRQKNIQVFYMR